MTSKKLPLWLVWDNPDTMADVADTKYLIMFKNGDGKTLCCGLVLSDIAL